MDVNGWQQFCLKQNDLYNLQNHNKARRLCLKCHCNEKIVALILIVTEQHLGRWLLSYVKVIKNYGFQIPKGNQ